MFRGAIAFFSAVFITYLPANAQKHLIEWDSGKEWPEVHFQGITNNGEYVAYTIHSEISDSLVLYSTITGARLFFTGVNSCYFTQDSKRAIYRKGDSICIMELHQPSKVQYITGVSSEQVVKCGRDQDLLVYHLKQRPGESNIKMMEGDKDYALPAVEAYWVNSERSVLIFENTRITAGIINHELHWLDVATGLDSMIWKGDKVGQLLIDGDSGRCVFYIPRSQESSANSIWLYRKGDTAAHRIADDRSFGMDSGICVTGIICFNSIDNRTYVGLKKFAGKRAVGHDLPVGVWSYKDAKLQSRQLFEFHEHANGDKESMAVININDKTIFCLHDDEGLVGIPFSDRKTNFVLLARHGDGDLENEWNWNKNCWTSVYLFSLKDGTRRLLNQGFGPGYRSEYLLSYNENYIYFYDAATKNYWCYRIADSSRMNMTSEVNAKWIELERGDEPDSAHDIYGFAGWIRNSDALLVYDRNDIFRLDPTSKTKVLCLTNGKSNGQDLVYRIHPLTPMPIVDLHQNVLLNVFDRNSKKQGLINLSFDSLMSANHVSLEPFAWEQSAPVKARDTNLYVVGRMTAEQSMNLFLTTDFSHYTRISNIFPERNFNWLTTELVTWKTFDGTIDQGILYKPENFDPHKKYPMLIHYYERKSDNLHNFIRPEPSNSELNIPFFVSHGYLVFTPDIHYKVGRPGKSAYNAIVSGALYLASRSYVDDKKMGLQGFSFGGFETNYVITHSHLFAAAMSVSGMSDFISAYGSIIYDGTSRQRQYELYRDRMGTTPWQRPDLYIENSPVLRADKVTTPLLMMANTEDANVPVQQGIEFFTALRRLGKKVWMLQYDGENHNLAGQLAKKDLTERMFQFFNYYLKGEPAPKWMTKGIPAALKGIDTGLEFDTSGSKP
ncbi:alpha/beta hydrolase family protein [Puia dinghuensis]|nr:prolyl oligopeptidase family serine peptidase [Puia dinghuensis]